VNLPNVLTLTRVGLSFLLVWLLGLPGLGPKTAALAVFTAAGLTDLWDGRIARRRNLISNFGILMDPIADKVLVLFAFIAFMKLRVAPAWMVLLIVARELGITLLRMVALAKGQVLPAEASGKVKAAAQMVTIALTLLFLIARERFPGGWVSGAESGVRALMFLTVLLTLGSGFSFLRKNRKAIFGS